MNKEAIERVSIGMYINQSFIKNFVNHPRVLSKIVADPK
jgi:hypothetical protein